MTLIDITTDNPEELLASPDFPVLPSGVHLFTVANKLTVEQTSTDPPKDMVRVELRCQDEDENKGMPIFDQFLFVSQALIDAEPDAVKQEKLVKTRAINNRAWAQFLLACGVKTEEQVKAGDLSVELDDLFERTLQAKTKVTMENVYPEELGDDGKPKKAARARVAKYLFKPDDLKA